MHEPWNAKEAKRLRKLGFDPVRTTPEKLTQLVSHFKGPRPSVFAVTDGGAEPHVSKHLAKKVRSLTPNGQLDWVLARQGDATAKPAGPQTSETSHHHALRLLAKDWLDEMKRDEPAQKLLEPLALLQKSVYSAAGLMRMCDQMETVEPAPEILTAGSISAPPDLRLTKAESRSLVRLLEHLKDDHGRRIYDEMRFMEEEIVPLLSYELAILTGFVPGFVIWSLGADGRKRLRQDALFREQLAGLLPKAFNLMVSDILLLVYDDVGPSHPLRKYHTVIDMFRFQAEHQLQLWQSTQGLLLSPAESTGSGTLSPRPALDVQQLRNVIASGWMAARQPKQKTSRNNGFALATESRADLGHVGEVWLEVCRRLRTNALRFAELWPAWQASRGKLMESLAAALEAHPFPGKCTQCSSYRAGA